MKSTGKAVVFLPVFAVSFVLFGAVTAFACAGGGGMWAEFQHNWHHSGRSTCDMSGDISNLYTWDIGVDRASPVYRNTVDETVYEGNVFVASDDGRVYALSDTDWSTVWQSDVYSGTKTTPLMLGGRLMFGSGNSVIALNVYTGAEEWTYTGAAASVFGSDPAAEPGAGVFYIGSDDGNVYAFNANTGSVAWTYQTGGPVKSSPATNGGLVYAGSDDGYMYALSAANGGLVWRTQTVGQVRSSPTVYSDSNIYLIFGVTRSNGSGMMYGLNMNSGSVVWSRAMPAAVESSAALDNRNGRIYAGSDDGKVYAMEGSSGDLVWQRQTGGAIRSSPAITDQFILAGSGDGYVYGLAAYDGSVLWSYDAGGPLAASFAIDSRKIFGSTASQTFVLGVQEVPLEIPSGYLAIVAYAASISVFYLAMREYVLLKRSVRPGNGKK